jgi:DNA repair protein RecO (recombination protein O)
MMALAEMAELTLALSPDGKPAGRVFDLLKEVLGLMAAGGCSRSFALLYKARLLAIKGYAPALSGCARCGREALRYVQSQGGVICPGCRRILRIGAGEGVRLSAGSVKLYGAFLSWELPRTPRIRASAALLDELSNVVDSHIEHVLSRPLRTRETKPSARNLTKVDGRHAMG